MVMNYYAQLGRKVKMSNEIRIGQRRFILIVVAVILLFVYTLSRDSCVKSPQKLDLPTIYAITPTYYRSVQKAELTR